MGMLDAGDAADILNAILGTSPYPVAAGSLIRLGSTAPAATVIMTQIIGNGYTPGGAGATWTTAAPGSPATAVIAATLSWLNSSGATWLVTGVEEWDDTPKRHLYGTWNSAPVSVFNGNTFQVDAGGLQAQIS